MCIRDRSRWGRSPWSRRGRWPFSLPRRRRTRRAPWCRSPAWRCFSSPDPCERRRRRRRSTSRKRNSVGIRTRIIEYDTAAIEKTPFLPCPRNNPISNSPFTKKIRKSVHQNHHLIYLTRYEQHVRTRLISLRFWLDIDNLRKTDNLTFIQYMMSGSFLCGSSFFSIRFRLFSKWQTFFARKATESAGRELLGMS